MNTWRIAFLSHELTSLMATIIHINYSVFLIGHEPMLDYIHHFAAQFMILSLTLYFVSLYLNVCFFCFVFLHKRKIQEDRSLFHRCIPALSLQAHRTSRSSSSPRQEGCAFVTNAKGDQLAAFQEKRAMIPPKHIQPSRCGPRRVCCL